MKEEKYALLVIDMQLVAFDGKITPPVNNGPQLLQSVSSLINACRSDGLPVVYLQTNCPVPGLPYAQDAHGWEIHPDLIPQDGDRIVFKEASSGFDRTDLHDVLQAMNINALAVCGVWSQFCVASTCKDALALGYTVRIAASGHGTVADTDDEAQQVVAAQNKALNALGILPFALAA